ncbi:MAG: hypothetical protein GX131_12500 [candidate division WS1 bacterium]|nr:hypothetical protein [candidate division WS1 bacterium]
MKSMRAFLCLMTIIALSLPASAQQWWETPELVEDDHVYSMDFVTPHVKWANPLPDGPIRVLFFVRAKGEGAREVAEMAQRLEIEPRVVYYESTGDLISGGEAGMQRALKVIREGADAFVFANVRFEALSREAQYYVLEQVIRDGKGLLAAGLIPSEVLTAERRSTEALPPDLLSSMPLASLSAGRTMAASLKLTEPTDTELAGALLKGYRLGAGRALALKMPVRTVALTPRLDFSFEALTEYEYWAAFAANAIRWVAGRDAQVHSTNRPDGLIALHRDDLPQRFSVEARSDLPGTTPLTIRTGLMRSDGERIAVDETTLDCAQGQTVAALPEFPRLPAGDHVMEVVVSSPRGVEVSGAQIISVTATRGIESVSLDQTFAEVGETVTGTVAMRGQNFGPDERLMLRLRDAEGRVVAQQETAAQGGEVPLSFVIPEDRTILMRAEAALVDADGEIDRADAPFRVPRRNRGQFNFVMWDQPTGVVGYRGLLAMREAGVTTFLGGSAPAPEMAAADMARVPYTTRILEQVGEDDIMTPVCWNAEPDVTQHIQEIADKYYPTREHGVYVYSLGDENHTRGACTHPQCMAAYREWLAGQYNDIAALNASWGTDFASFDAIELYEAGDYNENAALNAGQFSRWYDRQAFKRYNYAQYCGRYAEAYKAMDPQAITGFEGAGSFGDDYDEIIQRVGFWAPYPNIGDDIIRSLAPRELITANWMGYSREAAPMVQRMWRMVSNGTHGVWWWRWDNIGRFHGFLAPDFHPWGDTSQVVVDEMADIQDGVGTMMLEMEMPHDGIGLLYSMPSAFADGVAPHRTGPLAAAHNAFLEATQDLGFQGHYLSDRTVAAGDLNDGDERVLLLPMGRAIPDEVAAEIREFVQSGGLLIADLRPGIRDGHCKALEAGTLDDVFGIAQRPTAEDYPAMVDASINIRTSVDGREIALALDTKIDPALTVTAAEALADHDGVPLLTVNRFGEGHAVLLNFSIGDYNELRAAAEEMPIRDLLGAIYAMAQVEPPYEQQAGRGSLRWTETVRWEADGLTLLMHFRTAGEDGPAATLLPEARHVYDLRNDRYLGETREVGGGLRVSFANLYAITEQPSGELLLEARTAEVAPGEEVRLTARTRGGGPEVLPIKLRVFRPDGTEEKWPPREVVARDGVADVSIPMAFNAMPGTWRIHAREVLSGQTAEAEVTVAAQ